MGKDLILPNTSVGGGGILATITAASHQASVTASDYFSSSKNFSVSDKTLVCTVAGTYTLRYCYAHTYSTNGKIFVNSIAVVTLPIPSAYGEVKTITVELNAGDVVTASTISSGAEDRYSVLVVYILKE